MALLLLRPVVQHYAWGDYTTIPQLLGLTNEQKHPHAELWLGTHPRGEALVKEKALSRVLGGPLPYLFKVLAVRTALSIQVHPSRSQAEEGFAREEAAGIAIDAFHRNYRDENHKPELLLALEDFWALSSFREFQRIRESLHRLTLPEELVRASSLEELFHNFLTLPASSFDFSALMREISMAEEKALDQYWWVQELFRQYGEDRGIFSPLFLNVVHLRRGDAIYLDARELHAYLRGTGVELMASSDNVLRFGCTKKHIDVHELLRVLRFESRDPQIIRGKGAAQLLVWNTPAEEFELSRIQLQHETISYRRSAAAEILMCLEGAFRISSAENAHVEIAEKGQSYLCVSENVLLRIEGSGVLYRAALPQSMHEFSVE